jgi:hypothetical protein
MPIGGLPAPTPTLRHGSRPPSARSGQKGDIGPDLTSTKHAERRTTLRGPLAGNTNGSTGRPPTFRDNRTVRTVGTVAAIPVGEIFRIAKRNGLRHSVES